MKRIFHLDKSQLDWHWQAWRTVVSGLVLSFLADPGQATPNPELQRAGVVVEKVDKGSVLAKAGLVAGDILLIWERLPNPPANPEGARGQLKSVFDWLWMEIEQAPRGSIRLIGTRGEEQVIFEVPEGGWDVDRARVRARMSPELTEQYLRGKELVEAKEVEQGVTFWQEIGIVAEGRENGLLQCWLYLRIGEAWSRIEAWQKSHEAYRLALEATSQLLAQVSIWDAIGRVYEIQGDYLEAESSYSSALEIWRSEWCEGLGWAKSKWRLGRVISLQGGTITAKRNNLAESLMRASIDVQERLAPRSFALGRSLSDLGVFLSEENYCRRALRILTPDSESLAFARVLANMGGLFLYNDLVAAESYLQRALDILKKLEPSWLYGRVLRMLGVVASRFGDLELAEEYYLRSLRLIRSTEIEIINRDKETANVFNNIGVLAASRGEFELAIDYHKRSLGLRKKIHPGGMLVSESLTNIGNVELTRGDFDKAEKHYREALRIQERISSESSSVWVSLVKLGYLSVGRGRLDEAESYYQRAGSLNVTSVILAEY